MESARRGWYSRGYLPHIDAGSQTQFLTWRLADSMPADLLEAWRTEIVELSESEKRIEIYRRVEAYLDAGKGRCELLNANCAQIVQNSLLFGHENRYTLHAWCVMPNHVHALLTPNAEVPLAKIMQTIKSFTSNQIHAALGGDGRFWQPDYFDRLIRDETHFERTWKYIEWNPVKAKLCADPSKWAFSSASFLNSERISD